MLIKFNKVKKQFNKDLLFSDFNITIVDGERIGIFGENGTGKTTILDMLAGVESTSHGSIKYEPGIDDSEIVYFNQIETEESTDSAGEKSRQRLEYIFQQNGKIWLFDEPTNHLDKSAINWLVEKIKSLRGIVFIASHDKEFLDRVVSKVWFLKNQKIEIFKGSFSNFEYQKTISDESNEKTYRQILRKIVDLRENDKKRQDHFSMMKKIGRADPVKVFRKEQKFKRQSKVYKNRIRRLLNDELPRLPKDKGEFLLNLLNSEAQIPSLATISDISKKFGRRQLFNNLSFEILPNEKILLIGKNGAGKTTLLNMLFGLDKDFSGQVEFHDIDIDGKIIKPSIYYFKQENFNDLNYNLTVRDELIKFVLEDQNIQVRIEDNTISNLHNISDELLLEHLNQVEFTDRYLDMETEELSEGEKIKLRFAKLLLKDPHLLLLDEPTNHLDDRNKQGILKAIRNFKGAMIVATHDSEVINSLNWDYRIEL